MCLYRETRQKARRLLSELKKGGYDEVRLEGNPGNDLVDVCRLTCLEQEVKVIEPGRGKTGEGDERPVLHIDGRELSLKWPKEGGDG
jgi:hypothetical protein